MTTAEKLTTIAENQQKVYDAGHDAGVAQGEQDAYDRFWDSYQHNGNRTGYAWAFAGWGWDDNNFKPKYDIIASGNCEQVFRETHITDLKRILEERGLTLDFSGATTMGNAFLWSTITRLPVMDCSSVSSLHFYYAYCVKSIDKLVLKQDGSQTFVFDGCGALETIVFEGVIGQNLGMGDCKKLKRASIENIFSVLSTTATGKTATFSQTAVNNAFTTEEWNALKATKSNWTIALA